MTGDYVIGHLLNENSDDATQGFVEEVFRLTADCLVLGVLGNHDHRTNAEKVRAILSNYGVFELNNSMYSLWGGDERQLFVTADPKSPF